MEVAQPRRSTRLAQRVNTLQLSGANRCELRDGVMTPAAPRKELIASDLPIRPLKKKAATSSSKPKPPKRIKTLGKLSSLLSLPLDIFFEITSHLHPLDLLHLSRASRHFAHMFLGTRNRHAWLAARRTVDGLPDCPSDLSEARYAHLLFESICSGCGKIGRRLLFNLRVRFCASCYKAKVEIHTTVDGVDHPLDTMLQIVPHNYSATDSSVIEYFEDQYNTVIDEFLRVRGGSSGDVFLKERQDAVLALVKHGILVSDFLDELQERKELEKLRLRVTRKLQIDARIWAMGYTHNEIPETSAAYQEEIMKPKALTERAWRGMADKMRGLAASRREQVLRERVLVRLREWIDVYGSRYILDDWPTPLNAAQADIVMNLLSEADARIPFTISRFNANSERILADIVAWREKAKLEVVNQLAEVYDMPKDAASLYYASAVICCGECTQVLFASDVMNHLHLCENQSVLGTRRNWEYDATLHQMARTLLYHAGLLFDVNSKQVEELEGKLACSYGKPTTGAPMGFLELVTYLWRENWSYDETFKLHMLGGGPSHCDNEQRAALDDDDPPQVVLLEMELPTSSTSLYPRIAEGPLKDDDPCCRLCGEACYMQVDMRCKAQAKRHMQVKHGKAEVLEEYLCPARDIFQAARDYVDAHGGQLIVTRMARC